VIGTGVIYELIDPRDMSCKYVGQTFCLEKRSVQHRNTREFQGNTDLFFWKSDLAKAGLSPIIKVIEENVDASKINERERFWCAQRSNEGSVLLNRPVGAIRREDLFGSAHRAEIAAEVGLLREMLLAIGNRYSLPVGHRISKEFWKCEKALLKLKHSYLD
jgi:hypothetical protein